MPATDKPILDSKGALGDPSQAIVQETAPVETEAGQAVPDGYVLCTVTKAGAGKVSKGEIDMSEKAIDPTNGLGAIRPFPYFDKGDTVALPKAIADSLEDRGLVTT